MTHLEKQVATLIKEVRQLKQLHKQQKFKHYDAKAFANEIGIAVTTLRIYMSRAKKGDERYRMYLPLGIAKSGRSYWLQEQVDDFWGVGL